MSRESSILQQKGGRTNASLLCEMPCQEGNEGSQGYNDEEWEAGYSGEVLDYKGTVVIGSETIYVTTEVNLKTKQVTEVIPVQVPEFTASDQQEAISIAKADPKVRELLNQGASMSGVSPMNSISVKEVIGPHGELHREGSVEVLGDVRIELGEKEWHAVVDLDAGKVLSLGAPSTATVIATFNQLIFRTIAPFVIILGILILIGTAIKNRLARAIAGIASIVLGIIGLFGGLYAQLPTAWNQALLFGIPIIGLVIGIVEIRRRATGKWMAITGVVICSIALVWDLVSLIAYLLAGHGF